VNEIEHRIKHAQKWRRFLKIGLARNYLFRAEWCVCVGLCETAGWINNQNHFLKWVKPGCKEE